MNLSAFPLAFATFQKRFAAFEQTLTRRSNVLIFLIVRFVLMSAMVVGFAWATLELSS